MRDSLFLYRNITYTYNIDRNNSNDDKIYKESNKINIGRITVVILFIIVHTQPGPDLGDNGGNRFCSH